MAHLDQSKTFRFSFKKLERCSEFSNYEVIDHRRTLQSSSSSKYSPTATGSRVSSASSSFNILYQNVDEMRSKTSAVSLALAECTFDVVVFVES